MQKQLERGCLKRGIIFISLCLVIICCHKISVKAEEKTIVHQGKSGDIQWTIYSDGLFTLTGEGEFKKRETGPLIFDKYGTRYFGPAIAKTWEPYISLIKYAKIDIKGVTSIAGLFSDSTNLEMVDFGSSDLSNVINAMCLFSDCSSLTEIKWGSTRLDSVMNTMFMFNGCSSINEIDASNMSLDECTQCDFMFADCIQLTSILGMNQWNMENVTSTNGMFRDDISLETIDLSTVNFSNRLKSTYYMFIGCQNLHNVIFQKEITNKENNRLCLCDEMFEDSGIESIIIPEGITEISFAAFRDCISLESVTLPDTVKKIDEDAFRMCEKIKTIKLPKSLQAIEKNAFLYSGIEEIEIPDNVTSIGETAFAACHNLKKFYAGRNLKIIGKNMIAYGDVMIYGEYRSVIDKFASVNDLNFTPLFKLKSYQAVVNGDRVDLRYYMEIPPEITNSYNIELTSNIQGQPLETSECIKTQYGYMVSCSIPIEKISNNVHSDIRINDKIYTLSDYSINTYLNTIIQNPNETEEFFTYKKIAKSLLRYCNVN